jgi:hypothetical protein
VSDANFTGSTKKVAKITIQISPALPPKSHLLAHQFRSISNQKIVDSAIFLRHILRHNSARRLTEDQQVGLPPKYLNLDFWMTKFDGTT